METITETKVKLRPGRKPRKLKFPSNRDFTVKEIAGRLRNLGHPMTVVALTQRLKKEILAGKFKIVGTKNVGRGKPAFLYRAIEIAEAQKEVLVANN